MKQNITIILVVSAIISAVLWLAACFVRMTYRPQVDKDGWTDAAITNNGNDILRTADMQTKWNAAAALFSAIAAISQAILYFCPLN